MGTGEEGNFYFHVNYFSFSAFDQYFMSSLKSTISG